MRRALVAALVVVALSCCGLSVVSGAPTRIQIDGHTYDFPEEWTPLVNFLLTDDAQPGLSDAAPATDAEVAEQHVQVSQAWTEVQNGDGALGGQAGVRFPVTEQHMPVPQAWSQVQNGAGASLYGQAGGSSQVTWPVALVGHAHHQAHAFVDDDRMDFIGDTLEDHENAVKAIETWRAENPRIKMDADMLNDLIELHVRIAKSAVEDNSEIQRYSLMHRPCDDLQKEVDARNAMLSRVMAVRFPRETPPADGSHIGRNEGGR